MSNISKMLSAIWGFLCLVAAAVLIIVYANFPAQFNWQLPEQLAGIQLNKERFFYLMIGAFLALNLLYYLFVKLLDSMGSLASGKFKQIPVMEVRLSLKIQVLGLNIFLIFFMIYVKMTSTYSEAGSDWYSLLFLTGPAIMLLGLALMFYWLLKPTKLSSQID